MIRRPCVQCYKYLFYKFYRSSLVTNKDRTGHETHAALILSGFMCFNFLEIAFVFFSAIYLTTGHKPSLFLMDTGIRPYMPVVVGISALLIMKMNFIMLKNIGYQNIIQEFSNESQRQRRLGNVLVGCYGVISFLLVFVTATLPG